MNAHQAAQERGDRAVIDIEIERETALDLGPLGKISGFTITDNGSGFTDDNMDSFNTTFSQYKESRGGKGLGRFLYLKAFEQAQVSSVFEDVATGTNLRSPAAARNSSGEPMVSQPPEWCSPTQNSS